METSTHQLELDIALAEKSVVDVGERVALCVRVKNHGADLAGEARLQVTATVPLALLSCDVRALGEAAGRKLAFALPALLHGEICELAIDAYALRAGDGQCVVQLESDGAIREAQVQCTVQARAAFAPAANRLELCAAEAEAGATVDGRLVITNTGHARALVTNIAIVGDLEVRIDPSGFELAPGERRMLSLTARIPADAPDGMMLCASATCSLASSRDLIALGTVAIVARSRPRIEGRIACATSVEVEVGDRVDWQVRLDNTGGAVADALAIAVHVAGGTYVPGTTAIEDARVIDVAGTSPLWSPEGLRVEQLPAGVGMTIAFSTVAEPSDGGMIAWARIVCAGRELLLESLPLAIRDWGMCAVLPFTPCGVLTRAPGPPPAAPTRRVRRSQHAALEPAMATYIRGLSGLMRHLWALAVLCADQCDDAETHAPLAPLRVALRSVFDRLAIKLRMPHYPVRTDDVLDPAVEDALRAGNSPLAGTLGARLARVALLIASERDEYAEFAIYRDALHARLEAFADDTALIDALVATQPALDAHLDAVLERELGMRT